MDDLTQKTNEELFVLYKKERNPEIRRELTMRYLYIATSVARQMYDIYSSAMQMEDAVNEGVLAIMRGIDSYDPDKNVKFSTYISPRIRGVMLDYMRKQEWMPRGYRKQLSLIEDAMQTLETDLGRPPTKEEVAEHVGLSVKRCQRILSLRSMSLVQSLDVMMQDEKTTQGSQIPGNEVDKQPEEAFMREEQLRMLSEAISTLDQKERTVLALYYVEQLKMERSAGYGNQPAQDLADPYKCSAEITEAYGLKRKKEEKGCIRDFTIWRRGCLPRAGT